MIHENRLKKYNKFNLRKLKNKKLQDSQIICPQSIIYN